MSLLIQLKRTMRNVDLGMVRRPPLNLNLLALKTSSGLELSYAFVLECSASDFLGTLQLIISPVYSRLSAFNFIGICQWMHLIL